MLFLSVSDKIEYDVYISFQDDNEDDRFFVENELRPFLLAQNYVLKVSNLQHDGLNLSNIVDGKKLII